MSDAPASPSAGSPRRSSAWPRVLRRLGVRRRRWDRGRFTELGLTLAWTVPLTLLLWVWAQTQQIASETVPGVRIALSHERPRFVVSRPGRGESERQAVAVTIELRGSRGAIQEVARELRSADAGGLALSLDLEADDRVAVDLRRELDDLPLFQENGVTVAEVAPATVEVAVEPLVEAAQAVAVGPGGLPANELAGEVAFDPPQVAVTGPAGMVAALATAAAPVVTAQLPADAAVGPQSIAVRVELSRGALAAIDRQFGTGASARLGVSPATVTATFERQDRQFADAELPSVPIWVTKPAGFEGLYRVELEQQSTVLNAIVVNGPPDVVRRLRSGNVRDEVRARLPVLVGDRESVGSLIRRQVTFELPPDVTVQGEPPEIAFRLVPAGGELP